MNNEVSTMNIDTSSDKRIVNSLELLLVDSITNMDSGLIYKIIKLIENDSNLSETLNSAFSNTTDLSMKEKSYLLAIKSRWRQLETHGGLYDPLEVMNITGYTSDKINQMRINFELLSVDVCNEHMYPIWQFHDGSVIEGLSNVFKYFHSQGLSFWAQNSFFINENKSLKIQGNNHLIPYEALKYGKIDDVLKAARSFLTHGNL